MLHTSSVDDSTAAYSKNVLIRAAGSISDDATVYGHIAGVLAYEQNALDMPLNQFAAFKLRALAEMIENTPSLKDGLQVVAKTVGQLDQMIPSTLPDRQEGEAALAFLRGKDSRIPTMRRPLTEAEEKNIRDTVQSFVSDPGTPLSADAPSA